MHWLRRTLLCWSGRHSWSLGYCIAPNCQNLVGIVCSYCKANRAECPKKCWEHQ